MKKFLTILSMFALFAFVTPKVEAQTNFISQYSNPIDTVLTGFLTKNLTLAVQPTSGNHAIEIQFTATKISGTVAGTVTVQESLDGVDWYTAPTITPYTLTDATQTTGFKILSWTGKFLRIQTVGTGTMSAQIKAKYLGRKLAVAKAL